VARGMRTGELNPDHIAKSADHIESLAAVSLMTVRNFRAAYYVFQSEQPMYEARVSLIEELESVTRVLKSTLEPERKLNIRIDRESLSETVLVDPELMKYVFHALLDNAVKYSYTGGAVVVDGRGTSDKVAVINITNRGLPISVDESERIFKLGYRSRSAMAVTGTGAGWGLYMARLIVQKTGGSLTYVPGSDPQEVTFRIMLPRRVEVNDLSGPAK
jgi:signal transduction histidine kinase